MYLQANTDIAIYYRNCFDLSCYPCVKHLYVATGCSHIHNSKLKLYYTVGCVLLSSYNFILALTTRLYCSMKRFVFFSGALSVYISILYNMIR